MELTPLRYFICIAKESNISRAAELLCVSQPSLTKSIKKLETELGAKLFIRGSRRLTLTGEGRLFLSKAEEIVRLADLAISQVPSNSDDLTGVLNIAVVSDAMTDPIVRATRLFLNENPKVKLNLLSGGMDTTEMYLNRDYSGIAISYLNNQPPNLNKIDLGIVRRFGFVMDSKCRFAKHSSISSDIYRSMQLIVPEEGLNFQRFSELPIDYSKLNIVGTYNEPKSFFPFIQGTEKAIVCLDPDLSIIDSFSLCFRPLAPICDVNVCLLYTDRSLAFKENIAYINYLNFYFNTGLEPFGEK